MADWWHRSLLFCKYYLGDTVPGAFFERGVDYDQVLYVNLYPEGSEAKNYHVRGRIWSHDDHTYQPIKVYWPNGGVTVFDDCDELSLTKKQLCYAEPRDGQDEGDLYHVQLTSEVAH